MKNVMRLLIIYAETSLEMTEYHEIRILGLLLQHFIGKNLQEPFSFFGQFQRDPPQKIKSLYEKIDLFSESADSSMEIQNHIIPTGLIDDEKEFDLQEVIQQVESYVLYI